MIDRYAQALVLLTSVVRLMEEIDDTLVVALLSEPLDLIAARAGQPTLRAA